VGEAGDLFQVSNNLQNQSVRSDLWSTLLVTLKFITGDDTEHDLYLPGKDLGNNVAGYTRNFAWGKLMLPARSSLFTTAIPKRARPCMLGVILGVAFDESKREVTNIFGNDCDIYYDPTPEENAYLEGMTYELQQGGVLAPVPLPASAWLFLGGLAGLGLFGGWRKTRE
jgi:hypothetical protein